MAELTLNTAPSLADLRARRSEILALAEQYKAHQLRVFGSVARGAAQLDSDIDFLFAFDPDYTLLDHSGLLVSLRELLGRNVDVVNEPFLRKEYRAGILHDAIWL